MANGTGDTPTGNAVTEQQSTIQQLLNLLGFGQAKSAGKKLEGRGRQLDQLIDEQTGVGPQSSLVTPPPISTASLRSIGARPRSRTARQPGVGTSIFDDVV